jgi:hypothetical protein
MKPKEPMRQLSVRLPESEYEQFHRMCHFDLKPMSEIVYGLIKKYMEKKSAKKEQ